MVEFINAKINIGLQIVRKREDGYHDLQTVFYPVGLYAGTPVNPTEFCDILEISEAMSTEKGISEKMPLIEFRGRKVECEPEKNLVTRSARMFVEETGLDCSRLRIVLDKHLPDGAGMGGGSADATFTLRALGERFGIEKRTLWEMARRIGADCPFFLENKVVYAEGIGDMMSPIDLDLSKYWIVVVKPDVYVSTAEAFRGITPKDGDFDLRRITEVPIEEWKEKIKNDFEDSIFPRFPEIRRVKEKLYDLGAVYASMTGSGSAVYGIYRSEYEAAMSQSELRDDPTIKASYLLKL